MTPGNDLLFVGYYLTRDDEGVKADQRCSNAGITRRGFLKSSQLKLSGLLCGTRIQHLQFFMLRQPFTLDVF